MEHGERNLGGPGVEATPASGCCVNQDIASFCLVKLIYCDVPMRSRTCRKVTCVGVSDAWKLGLLSVSSVFFDLLVLEGHLLLRSAVSFRRHPFLSFPWIQSGLKTWKKYKFMSKYLKVSPKLN